MNIEKDIFKRATVNFKKLLKYGFKIDKDSYIYEKNFFNNDFKAIISIDNKGEVTGKVIDLLINDEYTRLRVDATGEFINTVRESYINILNDIKNKCFEVEYFQSKQANRINDFIKNKYNSDPEFLWKKFPYFAVYRNENNNKWYAIIMNLDKSKLCNDSGNIEIINVKLTKEKVIDLLKKPGFYKAYHMNKNDWISIILDETLSDDEIISLIEESYNVINVQDEWIVPVNPKYYDITNCFNDKNEIIWKQSSDIHVGDIVYLYVANPFSKIMYKCLVKEVNIPYEYKDKSISMTKVMRIELLKKLDKYDYTFEYLNKLGIKMIRGPRKINKDISIKLQ